MTNNQDNYQKRMLLEEQLKDNKKKQAKLEEIENTHQDIRNHGRYLQETVHKIFTGQYNTHPIKLCTFIRLKREQKSLYHWHKAKHKYQNSCKR